MERKPAKNNTRRSKLSLNANKATWIAVGSLLLGLLTIAAGLFSTNKTLQINSEKDMLSTQISKEDELNDAMVGIREFLVLEHENCVNEKYTGDHKKLRKEMIKLVFALVDPIMTTDEVFDLAIIQKAQSFVALVYENKNICSYDYPSEKDLIRLQRELNLDMRKHTNETRQKIRDLTSGFFY